MKLKLKCHECSTGTRLRISTLEVSLPRDFLACFQDGSTTLMVASLRGYHEIVQQILDSGALPDLQKKVTCP